jgi:hypothetical protein
MLAFPDSGNTRAVVGSSAGYAARFVVSGSDGDRDHDGTPDASDNCPDVYNPKQSNDSGITACEPTVTFTKLDTTAGVNNRIRMKWWFEGFKDCSGSWTPLFNGACGTAGAPIDLMDWVVFNDGSTVSGPVAEVTWADGPDATTRGPMRVAVRNLAPPASKLPVRACAPGGDCAGGISCSSSTRMGLKYARFNSITLKADDSSIGFNDTVRWMDSNGNPTQEDGSLLGGIWYIDAQMEIRYSQPPRVLGSCLGGEVSAFTNFRSSPLGINQHDALGASGVHAVLSGTAPNRRLDITFSLSGDYLMNTRSCSYVTTLSMGAIHIYTGIKDVTGELHFVE